jgi:APA family basic amino acid/polyamine antiporter
VTQPNADRRGLRVLDGASLVVSTVIGAGIFTVPGIVATITGSASGFMIAWIAGGVLALAGALTYAELAARYPQAGGEYVYLREAFGPAAGFLSGWTSFIALFYGAIAASAFGFARYLVPIWPDIGAPAWATLPLGPVPITLSPVTLIAVVVIVLFTIISVAGVESSKRANNALAIVLVIGILVFLAVAVVRLPMLQPTTTQAGQGTGLTGILAALVPVMFTYSGWNAAAYVSNEFDDPRRTVPRALLLGTVIVAVLYVALNATYLRALSVTGVANSPTPGEATAVAIIGAAGREWLAPVVLAALASSVCAMVITGPRIYLRMAQDGAMPGFFSNLRASIVVQSIWSCILVLTGTFDAIVTYTGFAVVLFAGAAVAGVFVFRRRKPAWDGYRVWGFPFVPALFVLASALMLQATVRRQPLPSLAGAGLIAVGLPFYWWSRRTVRR